MHRLISNLFADFVYDTEISPTQAKESVVQVNIYYDTLGYTEWSESPKMTLASLFSLIGSYLSLFLSLSFFSLGEIVDVCIQMIYIQRQQRIVLQK